MKILCIKEPVVGLIEKDTGKYIIPMRTNTLPVSLLAVAARLRKDLPDSHIKVLDLPNNGDEKFLQEDINYGGRALQRFFQGADIGNYCAEIKEADCVLMSCNQAVQKGCVLDVAKKIKGITPKAKLVCGGQEVTRNPEEFMDFDLAYAGANLEKIAAALASDTKGIMDGGFGGCGFPALDAKFIGKGLNSYAVSTEGPLPRGVGGVVLPLKMSAGCGMNCEPCKYPYKECPLVFEPQEVIAYLKSARKFCRVLLITDEVTNLPQEKLAEVIHAARTLGFFLDYANTIDLSLASAYDDAHIELLFGRSKDSGCVGMCTYFTIKALHDSAYRAKVFSGLEKLIGRGASRLSLNLAVGRSGNEADIERIFSEIFTPMKGIVQGRIGFLFNTYHTQSEYFMLHQNPQLGGLITEKLQKINEGPLIDNASGGYRYNFPAPWYPAYQY